MKRGPAAMTHRRPSLLLLLLTGLGAAGSCYVAQPLDEAAVLRSFAPPPQAEDAPAAPAAAVPGAGPSGQPLSEGEAVRLALLGNPELAVLQREVGVARAEVESARMLPDSQLRFSNLGWREGESTLQRFDVGWRWRLPHVVAYRADIEAAEAAVPLAEAEGREAAWLVSRDVRLAYVEAVLAAERAELARAEAELRRRIADELRDAAQQGGADPLDVPEAELAWLESTDAVGKFETEQHRARQTLMALMGTADAATRPLPRADAGLVCPAPDPRLTSADASFVRDHPAVRRARAAHERAEATLKAEYGRRIPWFRHIQLAYEYDPGAAQSGVQASIAFDLPLFSWNRGPIAVAKAERQRQDESYRHAVGLALGGVRAGLARWQQARDRLLALERHGQPLAAEARRRADEAVASGRRDLRQALQTHEKALRIQRLRVEALAACRQALIETEHAAGLGGAPAAAP